jgi:toxin ParE1/3/4
VTRRVRLLKPAQADLLAIERYVALDSPATAAVWVGRLLEAIESLGEFAERGSHPRDRRIKTLGFRVMTHAPYLIFYRIHRSEVRVHRVVHGRREYQRLL